MDTVYQKGYCNLCQRLSYYHTNENLPMTDLFQDLETPLLLSRVDQRLEFPLLPRVGLVRRRVLRLLTVN